MRLGGRFARAVRRSGLAAAAVLTILSAVALAPAAPVDTVLGQVGSRTISASDVALARALGMLGFAPSAAPIERSDVERYVDTLLMLEESARGSAATRRSSAGSGTTRSTATGLVVSSRTTS